MKEIVQFVKYCKIFLYNILPISLRRRSISRLTYQNHSAYCKSKIDTQLFFLYSYIVNTQNHQAESSCEFAGRLEFRPSLLEGAFFFPFGNTFTIALSVNGSFKVTVPFVAPRRNASRKQTNRKYVWQHLPDMSYILRVVFLLFFLPSFSPPFYSARKTTHFFSN